MADLIAKLPCDGLLPLSIGKATLVEVVPVALTSVSPLKGAEKDLSKAMTKAHGVGFPGPNNSNGDDAVRAIWFGRAHALLIGPAPDSALVKHAALTDQTDAWAVVCLDGDAAESVLARLAPVDLRHSVFGLGQTVRSQLGHMTASITRVGENAFQIMVFRSMAKTLVHDLKTAMVAVDARG
ncbi:sarcosine oxidase subunit gamma [Phaeobacter marinintestinus]|uniref:sarcosine oxidase subunit gamma n=1 Tax=Falsiphaeobacter marinintestinus TaxID=1492905 RepID=UPI0011B4FCC0|nr:sarcosine oxidase subunit gamma [Phaeobacter marinintestinus]